MPGNILTEDEWQAIREVAKSLRYFAQERMYTYIDRIGDAFSPAAAIAALKDALRILRSEAAREQKYVYLPSDDAVEKVIKLIFRNREVASILASLSLAYPSKREEKQVVEEVR